MKNSSLEWLFCNLIQFWALHIGILNPGPLDTGHFGNHKDSKVIYCTTQTYTRNTAIYPTKG